MSLALPETEVAFVSAGGDRAGANECKTGEPGRNFIHLAQNWCICRGVVLIEQFADSAFQDVDAVSEAVRLFLRRYNVGNESVAAFVGTYFFLQHGNEQPSEPAVDQLRH